MVIIACQWLEFNIIPDPSSKNNYNYNLISSDSIGFEDYIDYNLKTDPVLASSTGDWECAVTGKTQIHVT